MVGGDEGVLQTTGDGGEGLGQGWWATVEQDIQLGVGGATAGEVVVGVVVQREGGEGVLGEEVLEQVAPRRVAGVHIGVTADVDWYTRSGLHHGDQDHVQGGEGGEELWVTPAGREVDGDMDGGGQSGDGEEDREHSGGGGGEDGDEGVEAGVRSFTCLINIFISIYVKSNVHMTY